MSVVRIELNSGARRVLRRSTDVAVDESVLSVPRAVSLPLMLDDTHANPKIPQQRELLVIGDVSEQPMFHAIACFTFCPVRWCLSSAVATGIPFTKSARSRVCSLFSLNGTCRITLKTLAS